MKSIVFLTLLVVVTMAIAQPVVKETFEVKEKAVSLADLEEEQPAAPVDHQRYKRATCDLLSFLNVSHAACTAHCLLKRFKGGYCNSKAVCVCRN
ncbi:defensin-A-like [Drosophila navojoa]|uniref:defensin-A-like n=1 Tax=Drosophila navojoa TaxID=7232 RepID=UPI000847B329|nr:defensin-A-like [Drosophila navojoa]